VNFRGSEEKMHLLFSGFMWINFRPGDGLTLWLPNSAAKVRPLRAYVTP
jgi:hypothetical protein